MDDLYAHSTLTASCMALGPTSVSHAALRTTCERFVDAAERIDFPGNTNLTELGGTMPTNLKSVRAWLAENERS